MLKQMQVDEMGQELIEFVLGNVKKIKYDRLVSIVYILSQVYDTDYNFRWIDGHIVCKDIYVDLMEFKLLNKVRYSDNYWIYMGNVIEDSSFIKKLANLDEQVLNNMTAILFLKETEQDYENIIKW